MWNVFQILRGVYIFFIVIAAISFFYFWTRTRFWLPRYVHYLALIALILAFGMVLTTNPEAPINQDDWTWLKQAATILGIPATVYFVFVFFGGQRAAYESHHGKMPCSYCGAQRSMNPDALCPNCGRSGDV